MFVGNLGPIPALVYGPIAFVVSLALFLIIESLLAANSRLSRKNTYIGLLVVCLIPIVYILIFEPLAYGIDYKAIARDFNYAERMEHAPPLTEQERLLLQSTHLNLRVGVVNAGYPGDIRALIRELKETCLFYEVGKSNQLLTPDVLATIITHYGYSKDGWHLSLHRPNKPENEVNIQVHYWKPYIFSLNTNEIRHQYTERLAVELIKANQTLFSQDGLKNTGSMYSTLSAKMPCEKDEE